MQTGNAFAIAAGLVLLAQEPRPLVLKASRDTVAAGQSVALTWTARGDAAFLTGVGKVPTSGSQVVTPLVPTRYVLVVQNGASIDSAAIDIDVTGARGDSAFPDIDDFSSPAVLDHRRGSNYAEFLALVHHTLQDTMSFHVRGDYLPGRPSITLYTDKSRRTSLIRPEDRGIRYRQLAYAVRVNEPVNGAIAYEIRTILEYQRTAETEWRPERDEQLIRSVTESLRKALAGGPRP